LDYSRWSASQQVVRAIATAGFRFFARIEAKGLENIPRSGPCLLALNHLSMADAPLLLTLLARRTIVLAVDELKRFAVLNWFVSDMGQAIYVKRNELDEESLKQALRVLEAGGLLAVGPEGRRSNTGSLLRGRTGIAYLATQADVPVVPLVAWGQEKWRQIPTTFRRLPIQVRAAPPIRFPSGPTPPDLLRQYTDRIMTVLAELLPPEYRGVYADAVRHPGTESLSKGAGLAP
jgi:1-acyl-sn-glycerol-3-phosphate acyltransferase